MFLWSGGGRPLPRLFSFHEVGVSVWLSCDALTGFSCLDFFDSEWSVGLNMCTFVPKAGLKHRVDEVLGVYVCLKDAGQVKVCFC